MPGDAKTHVQGKQIYRQRRVDILAKRAYGICLLKMLGEYSDRDHPMTMGQIRSKMEEDYGISPDRRTVYAAVSLLLELGYDISVFEENGVGYYLKSRRFEPEEIRLLIDCLVQA